MRLYEYLIGGKKTGQIEDLKDPMPESKSFYELKEGETFFISRFRLGGTRTYVNEIKISSIVKNPLCWIFRGFTKEGEKCTYSMWAKDLNKTLYVEDERTCYMVFSTFEMDDKPFFELIKKEIKNSKK